MDQATVDRTFEDCPEDPEIVVTLPCGHTERFFITGLSDQEYVTRAQTLKFQDAAPPGTRCTLRPLVDSHGRTHETWPGRVLVVRDYHPQGFALLDAGIGGLYPASFDRIDILA